MKEPRVYEVGYLLVPQIKEEELDAQVDALRKIITDKGGLPISEGRPELIDIAYPMYKIIDNKKQEYTKGYFGWIKFDVSPDVADSIKKELDALKIMIRNLMISTVREDTRINTGVLSKSATKEDVKPEKAPSEVAPAEEAESTEPAAPAPELTEEELDAKIDELAGEE